MARPAAKVSLSVPETATVCLLCGREGGDVVEDYRDDYVKMFPTILPEIDLKEPLPRFSTKN